MAVYKTTYKRYNGTSWDSFYFTPAPHTHGNLTNDGKLGTASKVAITDGSKYLTVSSISTTELGYLSGVTGNLQDQINYRITYNDVLMPTNPFGGKSLYINTINDSLYSADARFFVTITKHKRVDNGVEYPYINTSKSKTDDDYYVDGPIIQTMTDYAHNIFDGSYETSITCGNNEYLKVRIMYGSNTSPSQTTSYAPGYVYGQYFISYYFVCTPLKNSQCRTYCKYESQGLGWKTYNFTNYKGTRASSDFIEKTESIYDTNRTCTEFIIFGDNSNSYGYTGVTTIECKLSRPNNATDSPVINKYGNQNLYSYIYFVNPSTKTTTVTISPYGNISATTFTENGTALSNKYAPISHTHSYLPLSGGTLTGNISYQGTNSTSAIIKFKDNTSDAYGNGIAIGGGGIVVIGAGESSDLVFGSAGDESLYLAADSDVKLYSNAQNGISSAKIATFNTSGVFNAPTLSEGGTYLANKYLQISNYVDTKNTAGSSSKASTKLFLIGATAQDTNPQTYSNANCYVGTDNCLYSNGSKVLTSHQSLTDYATKTYVTNVAAGLTKAYVCTYADNPALNSSANYVDITSFEDIQDVTAEPMGDAIDSLKVGDIIYVVETDVPDRWVGNITKSGNTTTARLYKLEATKVDLTGYATQTWVTNKGYITGITKAMVTTALGYTPLQNHQTMYYRPVQVAGTEKLANTSSTALNFVNSGNVQFTYDGGLKASVDLSGYSTTGHTHSYLPLSGGVISGQTYFNTNTNTTPVIIRRLDSDEEAIKIGVNDSAAVFDYINDEKASSILFYLTNTDIENSDGSNASSHYIRFASDKNNIGILLDGTIIANQTTLYEGGTALSNKYAALSHTHSYLPLSGGTVSSSGTSPLEINSTYGTAHQGPVIYFNHSNNRRGSVGFFNGLAYVGNEVSPYAKIGIVQQTTGNAGTLDVGKPFYSPNNGTTLYEIYHTGNLTKVSQLTNDSGFTTNTGTVTSVAVKMNGSTKGTVTTSGTIDLGTVITAHQDISGKVDKTTAGVSVALNLLSEGTSDPQDNDYYISQYVGGGTTTTTYHRRPVSKLYNYIKGKLDSVYQPKGTYLTSHQDISGKVDKVSVTAGTYKRVTVNSQGLVTGGDNVDTDTNYYHTRVYSSGLKISTGTGVSDMYVPYASSTQTGAVIIGTGISVSSGSISVAYGTTAGTACQGNDSRLSDSRPASDVYSWAKASTKPSYSLSEINERGEAWLGWGGRAISGSVTPIGMSLSDAHSANRLAFINGDALTVEYSSDGGSTWTDMGLSKENKSLFCTKSFGIPVGRSSSSAQYTTSSRTRITITAQTGSAGYFYTNPKKMLINISSTGGMNVLVETRTGTNYKNNGAWSTFGTYAISGWSGWNDIPLILGTLGGGSSQTSNNWQLRLTFIMTSVNSSYPTEASVSALRIYGDNDWGSPSTMASTGHLYSYDINGNASFPATVGATTFTENGTSLSSKYLALAGGAMTGPLKWAGSSREIISTAYNDSSWKSGLKYSWASNTTLALWGKHKMTQFVWNAGTDFSSTDVNGTTTKTYDFQVGRDASDGSPIARVGGKQLATKDDVDSAIAAAITTVLNTPV